MDEITSDARTVKPGEPDHPAEQVKAAVTASKGGPVYQARIALHPVGDDRFVGPTIGEIEKTISEALVKAFPDYSAGVSAMRTDR